MCFVVQELDAAMNRALYGFLCNLGIQYMVGSLRLFIEMSALSFLHISTCFATIFPSVNGTSEYDRVLVISLFKTLV